jgi:putative transposase
MQQIKGGSSHLINNQQEDQRLYWQPGYGVLTFSRRDLTSVTKYVCNQKQHHQDGRLSPEMERWSEDEEQ